MKQKKTASCVEKIAREYASLLSNSECDQVLQESFLLAPRLSSVEQLYHGEDYNPYLWNPSQKDLSSDMDPHWHTVATMSPELLAKYSYVYPRILAGSLHKLRNKIQEQQGRIKDDTDNVVLDDEVRYFLSQYGVHSDPQLLAKVLASPLKKQIEYRKALSKELDDLE